MVDDKPDVLETHRARLEESLEKLRKALKIWQEQSAEYEGLREELLALPADATRNEMLAIAKDFGGTIITEKEIDSLLGNGRNTRQVADAVGHRINYVQENAKQVQNQLDKGEEKLTAVDVVLKPDQVTNEEGLPMMEIREELDEDGNVIESSVSARSKSQAIPMSLEALKSFKPFLGSEANEKTTPSATKQGTTEKLEGKQEKAPVTKQKDDPQIDTGLPKTILEPALTVQKQVDAQEDKPLPAKDSMPKSGPPTEGIASIKIQSDDEDNFDSEDDFANVPEVEEDEASAQMRRDMIKYNMNEIGAIVAEIDLEEGMDYGEYSDEDDTDELIDQDEEDEYDSEEDEHGRSLSRGVPAELHREMQALQDKIRAREDAEKKAELDRVNAKETQQQSEIVETVVTPGAKKSHKKGVRFAEELDISPAPINRGPDFVAQEDVDDTDLDPSILDMVFGPGTKDAEARLYQNTTDAPKPKGPSLFKATKMMGKVMEKPQPQPSIKSDNKLERIILEDNDPNLLETAPKQATFNGKAKGSKRPPSTAAIQSAAILANTKQEEDPESNSSKPILADTIVERPPTKYAAAQPPDELDSDVVRQEITSSYQQMRNRLVQRQGGYIETDEERQYIPLDEDGEKKKVSRFKARMSKG